MNLVSFHKGEVGSDGVLWVDGDRGRHLIDVCRVAPGMTLRVGEIGGGKGMGEVIEVEPEGVRLKVSLTLPSSEANPVHLIVALPRPQMLKRIIEFCGTAAVQSVTFIGSERVEKSYFSSPALSDENIGKHLRLGMEQGGSTYLPRVQICPTFHRFITALLPEIASGSSHRLVADPGGSKLSALFPDGVFARENILVAIGPEGGWIERELTRFRNEGFQDLMLGATTLRVETAVYYALAQIELIRRTVDE